jgi:hypothetical protein
MTKYFVLCAVAVSAIHAHATIWFGFTGASGAPVVAGLSSGPITTGEQSRRPYVGHFRLLKHFVGVGAFVMADFEREKAAELEQESASSEEFIAKMEKQFPDRRFMIGSLDGKILTTIAATGCNATNVYCGADHSGGFHVNGGGLTDQNVIVAAKRAYETQSAHLNDNQLTCHILEAIASSGGEIKDFQYGVIWTAGANGETKILESRPEAELLSKLKSRFCP